MKLTSVELHPGAAASMVALSLRDPRRLNPYNVKAITGLDADEIVPRFYGVSGSTKFYEMSLEQREIVIVVELNPRYGQNETPSDLRDALYKHISASRTGLLQLRFKNGTSTIAAISGFITKLESPHFTKNSEVRITVEGDEPMLKALSSSSVPVSGLNVGDFTVEDPFSTAPHGMKIELLVTAPRVTISLGNVPATNWAFTITPAGGFVADDVVHISSEHGNKYVYLVRSGSTTHLADKLDTNSQWPVMFPGVNRFGIASAAGLMLQSITYFETYWGV